MMLCFAYRNLGDIWKPNYRQGRREKQVRAKVSSSSKSFWRKSCGATDPTLLHYFHGCFCSVGELRDSGGWTVFHVRWPRTWWRWLMRAESTCLTQPRSTVAAGESCCCLTGQQSRTRHASRIGPALQELLWFSPLWCVGHWCADEACLQNCSHLWCYEKKLVYFSDAKIPVSALSFFILIYVCKNCFTSVWQQWNSF